MWHQFRKLCNVRDFVSMRFCSERKCTLFSANTYVRHLREWEDGTITSQPIKCDISRLNLEAGVRPTEWIWQTESDDVHETSEATILLVFFVGICDWVFPSSRTRFIMQCVFRMGLSMLCFSVFQTYATLRMNQSCSTREDFLWWKCQMHGPGQFLLSDFWFATFRTPFISDGKRSDLWFLMFISTFDRLLEKWRSNARKRN